MFQQQNSIFSFSFCNFYEIVDPKNTSRYGPFGPFVKCINNLESKYLGEKLARHGSLESLERPKCELINASKPRKKEVELSDHIQFLITEKSAPQASSLIEVSREAIDEEYVSDGKLKSFYLSIILLITFRTFTEVSFEFLLYSHSKNYIKFTDRWVEKVWTMLRLL